MSDELVVGPFPATFRRFWLPLGRGFVSILLFLLGPVRVRGASRVPKQGGLMILANHLSDIDPVVVQYACPRPIHFMAKSELFEMKVIGPLMRFFGAFAVKRGEPDRKALKHSADLMKAEEAVGVFPEGLISEDGRLQELKPGVALIARMAGKPVICVGLSGTQRMMPYGKMIPRPAFHRVKVTWGEAKTFGKETSAEEFLAWAERELKRLTI